MKVKWCGVVGKQWAVRTFDFTYGDADLRWINFYGVELPKPTSVRFKLFSDGRIIGDKRK